MFKWVKWSQYSCAIDMIYEHFNRVWQRLDKGFPSSRVRFPTITTNQMLTITETPKDVKLEDFAHETYIDIKTLTTTLSEVLNKLYYLEKHLGIHYIKGLNIGYKKVVKHGKK